MARCCYPFVEFCSALNDWPAAVLCMFFALLQMAVLDYYLVHDLGTNHLTWIAFDAVNITMLGISIYQARGAIQEKRRHADSDAKTGSNSASGSGRLGWITWFSMSASVAAKTVVIFHFFASALEEDGPGFWGPNTLKTTIALGSCTFLLLLMTQHDAPPGSEGRRYIEELTGTVVFDILDTVDIMEVLFDADMRDSLWPGLEEFILAVAVLNLILPTVPLFTLSRTQFGSKKPSRRLVRGHRVLLVLVINGPNLLIRLLLWHGLSAGISPFMLKNIILILMTFYDFYEQEKEEYVDLMEEKAEELQDRAGTHAALRDDKNENLWNVGGELSPSNNNSKSTHPNARRSNSARDSGDFKQEGLDERRPNSARDYRDSGREDYRADNHGRRPRSARNSGDYKGDGYRPDYSRRERGFSESDGSDGSHAKRRMERPESDVNFTSV